MIGTTNGTIGTDVSTNGNIGTNGTIGSRETFRVLVLPMVPLATNGTIGKISNGTIGRTPNARNVVSALGSFDLGRFGLSRFGLCLFRSMLVGRFGLIFFNPRLVT